MKKQDDKKSVLSDEKIKEKKDVPKKKQTSVKGLNIDQAMNLMTEKESTSERRSQSVPRTRTSMETETVQGLKPVSEFQMDTGLGWSQMTGSEVLKNVRKIPEPVQQVRGRLPETEEEMKVKTRSMSVPSVTGQAVPKRAKSEEPRSDS